MKYIIIIALSLFIFACKNKKATSASNVQTTRAIEKKDAGNPDDIQLNELQVQLGNILVDTIRNSTVGNQLILTAILNADQTKINAVSSRVMGRIEHLYFKNIGDHVNKGDKLYDIYSEELNNAKQEYVLNLQQRKLIDNPLIDFATLLQSAKNKLTLWGLSENQIGDLANKKESPLTTFYSPLSGYISTLDINEGEYSMEGGTIMRVTDLSTLWAEAQIYSSQLSQINSNATATLQFPNLPGKLSYGKVEFVNPEINSQTRITLLRVYVANNDNLLKPGMSAYVTIKDKKINALTLPSDAVIRSATGATVWIQTSERRYASRMIEIGFEDGNRVQITSGLKDGDIVVTSGAYLLNSEFKFKKGTNPMEGMKM
ncbi:MAG: efflux RND transporter periplasmic adaptor subunit [Ginsengibacter sp.]